MNQLHFVFTFTIAWALFNVHALKSKDLVEFKCIDVTECEQFENSGIQANCIDEHCQCSNATGDRVDCKPMDFPPKNPMLNNINGGPCPCHQPNSECDVKQDICYCSRDFMPSSDKRRCIAKAAQMGEKCEQNLQCQRGDYNGLCDNERCICMTLFVNDNGTCESIVGSRMFCRNNTDCTNKFGNNSKCFTPTNHCVCRQGFISSLDNSICLTVPKYLENCTENVQCISSMGPGGLCIENVCQCDVNFFVDDRKTENGTLETVCSPIVKPGEYCRHDEDCYQRQLNETEQSLSCIFGECNSPNDVFLPKINTVAQGFTDDLLKEVSKLPKGFPLISKVIEDAIDRVYASGRISGRDMPADVFKQKPFKLPQNVYWPTKFYPNFNFKGTMLGPKGNTLQRLRYETMSNIAIKGRTSIRDEEREEQLRQTGEPAFNHFNINLHVEIATLSPPAEAHVAYALSEIRKYIIPDENDEVSQEQYREMLEMNPEYVKKAPVPRSVFAKLAELKGGFRATSASFASTKYDESPSTSTSYEEKLHINVRTTAPFIPSFLERTRELRSRPYQKYSSIKK